MILPTISTKPSGKSFWGLKKQEVGDPLDQLKKATEFTNLRIKEEVSSYASKKSNTGQRRKKGKKTRKGGGGNKKRRKKVKMKWKKLRKRKNRLFGDVSKLLAIERSVLVNSGGKHKRATVDAIDYYVHELLELKKEIMGIRAKKIVLLKQLNRMEVIEKKKMSDIVCRRNQFKNCSIMCKGKNEFRRLCDDAWFCIFDFLMIKELLQCGKVCKLFYFVSSLDLLWKKNLPIKESAAFEHLISDDVMNWKSVILKLKNLRKISFSDLFSLANLEMNNEVSFLDLKIGIFGCLRIVFNEKLTRSLFVAKGIDFPDDGPLFLSWGDAKRVFSELQ